MGRADVGTHACQPVGASPRSLCPEGDWWTKFPFHYTLTQAAEGQADQRHSLKVCELPFLEVSARAELRGPLQSHPKARREEGCSYKKQTPCQGNGHQEMRWGRGRPTRGPGYVTS